MSDNLRSRMGRVGAIAAFALLAAGTITATPASAAAGEGCPNEQVRSQSNTNPATGQPYSVGLPECRAYEMVSPLEKQAHDATPVHGDGLPVAPDGETVGFASEGGFSDPENYRVNFSPINMYVSRRGVSGWVTSSAFAPASLVYSPFEDGLDSDFSPDLRSVQVGCGTNSEFKGGFQTDDSVVCALRKLDGPWVSTPLYTTINGTHDIGEDVEAYQGGSEDLSRVFIQPSGRLLPSDTAGGGSSTHAGIYEIAGLGTASPEIRLVNIDNNGNELLNAHNDGPLFGDFGESGNNANYYILGTRYHAISQSGRTVFFEATPPSTGVLTLYARIDNGEPDAHTVDISNPAAEGASECTTCSAAPSEAAFVGASADGSKVFFTTRQQLLDSDTDSTTDLYECDFNNPPGKNLVQVSGGGPGDPSPGAGADVTSVPITSSDGSHVYFVAEGILTTVPNGNGEVAHAGQSNLYAYDTVTGETKFVALGGVGTNNHSYSTYAQTTPDGRYLVFSNAAVLAGDTNTGSAVYRYDFQTSELTWVSHAASGFTALNEGKNALVAGIPGTGAGAQADIGDWDRAISDSGEYVIFTTSEKLQADDAGGGEQVYLWHNGTVSLISDGQDPEGVGNEGEASAAMSASGADIFFSTHTQLVGQDTDVLRDIYDARIAGGFPAPAAEPSCSGEGCQGASSPEPTFGAAPGSLSYTAGGNLTPGSAAFEVLGAKEAKPKPKPLTQAQKLANALKQCKKLKGSSKRKSCEKTARKKYAPKPKPKTKKQREA